jgi:hypothetical protein
LVLDVELALPKEAVRAVKGLGRPYKTTCDK